MSENTAVTIENKKKYKNKRKTIKSYKVTNEYLFYKIADTGLLHIYLHGVNQDEDGNKIFYFEKHDDIKEIIENFKESPENDGGNN